MQDFTVPTLSLSGSRAKKQHNNPVPTRDQHQFHTYHSYQSNIAYQH